MKSLRLTVAALAIASCGIASSASAATATANADATILAALDVQLDAVRTKLDFGSIAESGTGGTVTLTPAGALTCGSGLVCSGTTGTPQFNITGSANSAVNVSLASSTITLTDPVSSATMSVGLASSAATLTLDGTGKGNFAVGGLLTVGAGQTPGTYNGQLQVSVVYP